MRRLHTNEEYRIVAKPRDFIWQNELLLLPEGMLNTEKGIWMLLLLLLPVQNP